MPAGVSTGTMIKGAKRDKVIEAIAQGESLVAISNRLHIDRGTLRAVRDTEFARIQQRNAILRAQAEQNALLAGEQIAEALEGRKYAPRDLINVYGVNIDKVVALRPTDPPSASQHLHVHLEKSDIASQFNDLLHRLQDAKRDDVNSAVIEVECAAPAPATQDN